MIIVPGVYRSKVTLEFWEVLERPRGLAPCYIAPLKLSLDKTTLERAGRACELSASPVMRNESGYPCAAELEWYGPASIKAL